MLSMKVIVQSLGFKASSSLDSFIHEKLKSIKYEKLIGANVVLHKGGENFPDNNFCEIRLEIPGNDVFAKRHSLHFETAISSCIDALNESLKRLKSKQIHKRQAHSMAIRDEIINQKMELNENPISEE